MPWQTLIVQWWLQTRTECCSRCSFSVKPNTAQVISPVVQLLFMWDWVPRFCRIKQDDLAKLSNRIQDIHMIAAEKYSSKIIQNSSGFHPLFSPHCTVQRQRGRAAFAPRSGETGELVSWWQWLQDENPMVIHQWYPPNLMLNDVLNWHCGKNLCPLLLFGRRNQISQSSS